MADEHTCDAATAAHPKGSVQSNIATDTADFGMCLPERSDPAATETAS